MRVPLGLLALVMVSASLGASGCEGRPRAGDKAPDVAQTSFDGPSVAELDLSRGLPELSGGGLFGASSHRTHLDLVRTLHAIADGSSTKGVLVRLGTSRIGLASASEIGALLGAIGKAGKPVICHADDYNNGSMLLAALGCSRLWVSPAGSVDTVGIAAQLIFGNKLLTRLHVDVDFLQVGKYKGAEEPFTRDGPSPEARASLERTLGGIRAAWLDSLTSGRPRVAEGAFEDGPYAPDEAKAKGLVDEIGYPDDARDDAKKLATTERSLVRFGGSDGAPPLSRGIVDAFRSLSGASRGGEPHVAVVRAVGGITMGGGSPLGGVAITERDLGRVVTRLTKDASTKAVVLRIDSPGGSALASDLLWKRLMKLRADKPLVVSVGGMAASGGYYLACTANRIVAEPTSIVGSIGVVGGKLAFGHALEEIGVHAETVAASPDPVRAARAAYMSPLSTWDDPTRARVLASMTAIYELFLRRVAEGRGVPKEKIAESAEGQIFAGTQAKERGLVDELGGLERAIAIARELGKLPDDAPISVAGERSGLFDLLGGGDEETASDDGEGAIGQAAREASQAALGGWLEGVPEAAAFVSSAAPFASGERTLAALPFVVLLR